MYLAEQIKLHFLQVAAILMKKATMALYKIINTAFVQV